MSEESECGENVSVLCRQVACKVELCSCISILNITNDFWSNL